MRRSLTALKRSALFVAVTALAATVQAHPTSKVSQYACAAQVGAMRVERSGATAHITLAGRSYALKWKHSSIGEKFISPTAALIIDGDSAIFVSEDQLDLRPCTKTVPIAAAD